MLNAHKSTQYKCKRIIYIKMHEDNYIHLTHSHAKVKYRVTERRRQRTQKNIYNSF